MSTTLCPLPWLHLFVDGMGNFYNCCLGTSSLEGSRDSNGQVIRAGDVNSIKKHWNSLLMQGIRQSMLDGKKHSSCDGCWRVEDTGSKSFRSDATREFALDQKVQNEISTNPIIKYVDLRFGNLCNLACRMCIPYNTKKLFAEYEEMYDKDVTANFKQMNWYESPSFWEELFEFKNDFKRIHLAGGEPLLIKECWKFLTKISNEECAKNIRISYNTNLTRIPEDALKIWPKFDGIILLVSMDGVGRLNEFIRYPQKWTEIESNLWEIENNFEKYNVRVCQIQPTIQAYNIHRITEICDFLAQFKNIRRVPNVNLLFTPKHFSPSVLPRPYRQKAADKLMDYIQKVESGWNQYDEVDKKELVSSLKGIISYMMSDDKPEDLHDFIRHNDIYDVHRNQKILDFIPELAEVYK